MSYLPMVRRNRSGQGCQAKNTTSAAMGSVEIFFAALEASAALALPASAGCAYLCFGTGKVSSRKMEKGDNLDIEAPYAFAYGIGEGVPKLMFLDNALGTHYTVMLNDFKKIVDVHSKNSVGEYISILKISYRDCLKLLVSYTRIERTLLDDLARSLKIIRLTKLIKSRAVLLTGVDFSAFFL